ncbi:MAG: protein kinase [Xanthomonadales bacterium]|nr:protein kinase [Xanthomonadales bacterium]
MMKRATRRRESAGLLRRIGRGLAFAFAFASLLLAQAAVAIDVERPLLNTEMEVFSHRSVLPRRAAVTAIAEDRLGQVWLGTSSGVHRHDGFEWQDMRLQEAGRALAVRSMLATRDGSVRALDLDGGVHEWRDGAWLERVAKTQRIHAFGLDHHGRVLVAIDDGLAVLDGEQLHRLSGSRAAVWVSRIKVRNGQTLLLEGVSASTRQVLRLTETDELVADARFARLANGLKYLADFDVGVDGAAAVGGDQVRWMSVQGNVTTLTDVPKGQSGEPAQLGYESQILLDRDGGLWIAGLGDTGVVRYTPRGGVQRRAAALPFRIATALHETRQGSIWVGLWRGAVVFRDVPIHQRWLDPGSYGDGHANAVTRGADGSIWAARFHGLSQFSESGTQLAILPPPNAATLRSVVALADGSLLVAADHEIHRGKGGQWRRMDLSATLGEGRAITGLAVDASQQVWIGTTDGLYRLFAEEAEALASVRGPIRQIVSEGGHLWVVGDRLWRIPATGSAVVPESIDTRDLDAATIRSLVVLENGDVWLATDGSGLVRRSADGGLQRYGIAEGLPSQRFAMIAASGDPAQPTLWAAPVMVDHNQVFWIVSWKAMADGGVPAWRGYGAREGLVDPPAHPDNFPAAVATPDGGLRIATPGGLVVARAPPSQGLAAPGLAAVLVDNREVARTDTLDAAHPVTLRLATNEDPERIETWYRVDSAAAVQASRPGRIELGFLRSATTTVQVQFRQDGLAGPYSTITLRARLPVYAQWWFAPLLGSVLLALLGLSAWLAAKARRARRAAQEAHDRLQHALTGEWIGLEPLERVMLGACAQGIELRAAQTLVLQETGGVAAFAATVERCIERLLQRGLIDTKGLGWRLQREAFAQYAPACKPLAVILQEEATVIGPYRCLAVLGAGGMGRVFLGKAQGDADWSAIKVIRSEASIERLARLRREAEVLGTIQHPNVVALLAHGPCAQGYFLAMPWIGGHRLDHCIEQGLQEMQARTIVFGVIEALFAVHGRGLVHRDVKPQNVLVRADGSAVLIDFGVALQPDADTRMTSTDAIVGTPAYFSPESLSCEQPTAAADWWALGVLAHETMTQALPWAWQGLDEHHRRLSLLRPQGPPRNALADSLPEPWRMLIDGCLHPDPNQRQRAAAAFRTATIASTSSSDS